MEKNNLEFGKPYFYILMDPINNVLHLIVKLFKILLR